MSVYDISGGNFTIHRQAGTDQYYVAWSLTVAQSDTKSKGHKITKSVFKAATSSKSKDKMVKTTKTLYEVLAGFVVKWEYTTKYDGYKKGKKEVWYLAKTQSYVRGARDTKADLFTPPADAFGLRVSIKMVAKEYVKDKKNHTDPWFTSSWTTRQQSYEGFPNTPSIALFSIKGTACKVRVKFDSDPKPELIMLSIMKDYSKEYVYDPKGTKLGSAASTGYYLYEFDVKDISDFKASPGGTYQVQARIASVTSKYTKWSDWCDYTSVVNTQPDAPTLESCEATSETQIKVKWTEVENISKYVIEYVAESEDNFESASLVSKITVENAITDTITGLSVGTTYYIRVKSVNDSDESEPSNVLSAVLATKPAAPTTWSSATVMAILSTLETTEKQYLYWVHNSKDGSAQRSSELRIEISGTTYYLLVENPNKDEYGEYIDKTMELEFWSQVVYTTEGSNTGAAGTIYDLFKAGTGESIKWQARTKGIAADYGDWSVQRIIKAYVKPTISLLVGDKDGTALVDNILTAYPLRVRATTTPSTQTPISFYISILAGESYNDVNSEADEVTISAGDEIFSTYVDESALDILIGANGADLKPGINYKINAIVYMNSGLSAEATYSFSTSWEESSDVPDAEIIYNSTYRYTKIRPIAKHYIGNDTVETDPVSYSGTAITGTSTEGVIFSDSGITSANVGDAYLNNETFCLYLCTVAGDAATAKWAYITVFDFSESQNWYSGKNITTDYADEPVKTSEVTNALVNDYYLNTTTGDVFRCVSPGVKSKAIWDYVWNIFWQVSENTVLRVYRKNVDGSYTLIADDVSNAQQNTMNATFVKDRHPSFGTCTYRIVSVNTVNSGLSFADIVETYAESSIVIQWNEQWAASTSDPNVDEYIGSILELPANIKLSDSSSIDVTLAEYIGRSRPVSYYGTQKGESSKLSCEFPKEDTDTLATLRRLMNYAGDVYVREPSGLGYWANITVSYDRNFKELTIPVSLDIRPVEGGE